MNICMRLAQSTTAAIAVLAVIAGSAAATISPAGTAFTAANTQSTTLTIGNFVISCNTSTVKGTTGNPASSALSVTGGANITFSQTGGCPMTFGALGVGTAVITTHNTWDLAAGTVSAGSSAITLTLPSNAASMVITSVLGNCTMTFNASSLADATNTYTNATTSLAINDTTIAYTHDASPCPADGTTASFTAMYSVTNAISVT